MLGGETALSSLDRPSLGSWCPPKMLLCHPQRRRPPPQQIPAGTHCCDISGGVGWVGDDVEAKESVAAVQQLSEEAVGIVEGPWTGAVYPNQRPATWMRRVRRMMMTTTNNNNNNNSSNNNININNNSSYNNNINNNNNNTTAATTTTSKTTSSSTQ